MFYNTYPYRSTSTDQSFSSLQDNYQQPTSARLLDKGGLNRQISSIHKQLAAKDIRIMNLQKERDNLAIKAQQYRAELILMSQKQRQRNVTLSHCMVDRQGSLLKNMEYCQQIERSKILGADLMNQLKFTKQQLLFQQQNNLKIKQQNNILFQSKIRLQKLQKQLAIEIQKVRLLGIQNDQYKKISITKQQQCRMANHKIKQLKQDASKLLNKQRESQAKSKSIQQKAQQQYKKLYKLKQQIHNLQQNKKTMAGQIRRLTALNSYAQDKIKQAKSSKLQKSRNRQQDVQQYSQNIGPSQQQALTTLISFCQTQQQRQDLPSLAKSMSQFVKVFLLMIGNIYPTQQLPKWHNKTRTQQLHQGWRIIKAIVKQYRACSCQDQD